MKEVVEVVEVVEAQEEKGKNMAEEIETIEEVEEVTIEMLDKEFEDPKLSESQEIEIKKMTRKQKLDLISGGD